MLFILDRSQRTVGCTSRNPRPLLDGCQQGVLSKVNRYTCPMSPEILKAIRAEHAAIVEAASRAEVRGAHTGKLLLEIRATMDPFAWIKWLDTKCPIPKSAAHRYLNQARMLRKAA